MISVVMPVYNAREVLGAQIDGLSRQTYVGPWELILADNGSNDGTREAVPSWATAVGAPVRVVDASDRRGATHARNVGIAAAGGDFIALCDADDVVTPGWLEAMAEAARHGDLVAGALDDEPLNPPERMWRAPHRADGPPEFMGFMPYAVSANCGAWADVFGRVSWCEDLPHGGDDVEFSWQVQLAGFHLHFAPEAVVQYRYRHSLKGLAQQCYDYGRAGPQLYRAFRHLGIDHDRFASLRRTLWWLVSRSPYLLISTRRRGIWVRRASLLGGRLRGSLEHRTFFA